MSIYEQTITTNRFIRLKCVQGRNEDNVHVGEVVYGDITSFYIDDDGDSYMIILDAFGAYLGVKNLKRFRRVESKK